MCTIGRAFRGPGKVFNRAMNFLIDAVKPLEVPSKVSTPLKDNVLERFKCKVKTEVAIE